MNWTYFDFFDLKFDYAKYLVLSFAIIKNHNICASVHHPSLTKNKKNKRNSNANNRNEEEEQTEQWEEFCFLSIVLHAIDNCSPWVLLNGAVLISDHPITNKSHLEHHRRAKGQTK